MIRLKTTEVAAHRAELARQQGDVCALCGEPFSPKNPQVLDHEHVTGLVRGTLHRGCNSMLGVIENGASRYFLTSPAKLSVFLRNVVPYKFKEHTPILYPSHRSDEEKRLLRNKRAAAARKARKV